MMHIVKSFDYLIGFSEYDFPAMRIMHSTGCTRTTLSRDCAAESLAMKRNLVACFLTLTALIGLIGCENSVNTSPPAASPLPTPAETTAQPTSTRQPVVQLPWWNNRVFYEVFVRSFYDGNGDGVGDLRGLISKLDYLNDGNPNTTSDLGVTGLWLMPVMESPSYHGYDVTDYKKVQPAYGTNDDFKLLVSEAHRRGIAVIVDMVLNHTSDQDPWFLDAQKPGSSHENWYIWSNSDPGYVGPWNEEVWHPLNGRHYYGIFWSGMPDLNYRNPEVTAAMEDVSRYWLENMGADGFRLDAARHLIEDGAVQENTPETHTWLKDYRRFIKSVNKDALVVGEVWTNSTIVAGYIGDQLDLAFEFDLASAMVHALQVGDGAYLKATQKSALDLYPPGQYAAFLTNHDQNRVMSELGGDTQKAKVAATLLLTNPGVPFIYYGEEIGLVGQKPDEAIRTPMPWTATTETGGFTTGSPWEPLSPGYEKANVAVETADPGSVLNDYRALIQLRQAHPALQVGGMRLVDSTNGAVYAYLRYADDERLLVIANLSDRPVKDYKLSLSDGPLTGITRANVLFGSGEAVVPSVNTRGGFDAYTPLPELAPLTSIIINLMP